MEGLNPNKMKNKTDKTQHERRLQTIWSWVSQGYTNPQIRAAIVKEWRVTERQAYNYQKKAHEYAKVEIVREIGVSFAYHMETRLEMIRSLRVKKTELLSLMEERKDDKKPFYRLKEGLELLIKLEDQILKTLCDIAKIEGVYAPSKTDITSEGKAIQIYRLKDGTEINF